MRPALASRKCRRVAAKQRSVSCALDLCRCPDIAEHIVADDRPQKFIEVVDVVTIKTPAFRFVEAYQGLEVIPKAGTVLGYDQDEEITTPCDDCVLIMPSQRLFPGHTAVRLGRLLSCAS